MGSLAGDAITTASDNTFIGGKAGGANTTGYRNTSVGLDAGSVVTTGANNVLIGNSAGTSASPSTVTTGDNQIVLGDNNITHAHIKVDWTVSSDMRDKTDVTDLETGLEFINQLKPKTYRWDQRSDYSLDKAVVPDGTHKKDQLDIGFMAQEVEALEVQFGFDPSDKKNVLSTMSEDGTNCGIKYSKFVPMLVKAIQELSAEVEQLKEKSHIKCDKE